MGVRRGLLAAAVVLSLAACNRREVPVETKSEPPPAKVRALEVKAEPFEVTTAITGTLASRAVVEVKAETTGRVLRFDKEEGERVSAGEVVLQVDEEKPRLALREAETMVKVAEATLERARIVEAHNRSELERAQNLLSSGGITERDMTTAKLAARDSAAQVALAAAQLEQSKAALETAKKRLAECQIRAPISGEIYRKLSNKGAYVEPATAVFSLVDNARLELESHVEAAELGTVRTGQAVRFRVSSYPGAVFSGKVAEISPAVDVESRAAKVRIQINDPEGKLKAGMFAQGEIIAGVTRGILAPASALYRDDSAAKDSYLYVVEEGKAKRRGVKIGREIGNRVEITGGLKEGEQIVMERSIEVADGVAVKVEEGRE